MIVSLTAQAGSLFRFTDGGAWPAHSPLAFLAAQAAAKGDWRGDGTASFGLIRCVPTAVQRSDSALSLLFPLAEMWLRHWLCLVLPLPSWLRN